MPPLGLQTQAGSFGDEVRRGLLGTPKTLPCRFFYDAEGSRIFEQICLLPEYYPTRTELSILREHVDELAALAGADVTVIELGAGSATKTRLLFDALDRSGADFRYVPIDISRTALESATASLRSAHPGLAIHPIVAEYHQGLTALPGRSGEKRLFIWLGTSIGNLEQDDSAELLCAVRRCMAPGDFFLLGVDRRKERETLERAYDDSQGVTARFNLNLLARINRELGGRFELSGFRHRALYDDSAGRVEMHLVSVGQQRVRIDDLEITVCFEAGESIHTENSYKFSSEEIAALASGAGLALEREWQDTDRLFSVCLLAYPVKSQVAPP
jgi:dimethylhistidine N-methyltransferase